MNPTQCQAMVMGCIHSATILAGACDKLREYCIEGAELNRDQIKRFGRLDRRPGAIRIKMSSVHAFGIDIGGTGVKGAPADLERGELGGQRFRLDTPRPATPHAVVKTVRRVVEHFAWTGPVGLTFPGVVVEGRTCTAANLEREWIGLDTRGLFQEALGVPVTLLNDADAAGLAEVRYGAGQGREGVVLLLTIGTGIGSAVFLNGALVPNTELGHLELRGEDAEVSASYAAKARNGWSWSTWGGKLDAYLNRVHALLCPELIIIGGGASKHAAKFLPRLTLSQVEVVPAALGNNAGIIGAALATTRL